MQENVGATERIIRIAVGLALLPMFFYLDGYLRWVGLVGLVPLLTGIFKWCPGYFLLGIKLEDTK
jgi:hypothetical protein